MFATLIISSRANVSSSSFIYSNVICIYIYARGIHTDFSHFIPGTFICSPISTCIFTHMHIRFQIRFLCSEWIFPNIQPKKKMNYIRENCTLFENLLNEVETATRNWSNIISVFLLSLLEPKLMFGIDEHFIISRNENTVLIMERVVLQWRMPWKTRKSFRGKYHFPYLPLWMRAWILWHQCFMFVRIH